MAPCAASVPRIASVRVVRSRGSPGVGVLPMSTPDPISGSMSRRCGEADESNAAADAVSERDKEEDELDARVSEHSCERRCGREGGEQGQLGHFPPFSSQTRQQKVCRRMQWEKKRSCPQPGSIVELFVLIVLHCRSVFFTYSEEIFSLVLQRYPVVRCLTKTLFSKCGRKRQFERSSTFSRSLFGTSTAGNGASLAALSESSTPAHHKLRAQRN
eukprot:3706399-Rhodomonas_salina.2